MVLWSGVLAGAPIKARATPRRGPVHIPPGVTSPYLQCRNAPSIWLTEDHLPDLGDGQNKHAFRNGWELRPVW